VVGAGAGSNRRVRPLSHGSRCWCPKTILTMTRLCWASLAKFYSCAINCSASPPLWNGHKPVNRARASHHVPSRICLFDFVGFSASDCRRSYHLITPHTEASSANSGGNSGAVARTGSGRANPRPSSSAPAPSRCPALPAPRSRQPQSAPAPSWSLAAVRLCVQCGD
jgi:hypothetical protein